ncbi:MAG TPA: ABC transporter ATP-binding protein [Propionibacteriaceae bacterium]|nr:ABC transporter ATP-binding protein [Propionibacteriaceae bacterium]
MTAPLIVDAGVDIGEFSLDVAFTVAPGEVLGVVGPNGAGKSVLLRTLAGLIPLTRGRLTVGGQVVDDVEARAFVAPERRPVGLVFQDLRLFPHLDVRENIAFGPRSRGASRQASRAVADSWIDRLGLHGLTGRRPHQTSGGQAQRVALARALALDPDLLLLDEPMASLDARTRVDVRAELRRHLREFAGPVILVTHDPLEALVLADRLLVLEHGRVVQEGTPASVARHPRTDYVARLVGINLWSGTRDPASNVVTLDQGGTLVATPTEEARDATQVVVGLRPSAISLHTERPEHASPRNVWPGTITNLEMLTDRVRVQVAGEPSAMVDITAATVADLRLHDGQHVWLSAKATEAEAYGGSI